MTSFALKTWRRVTLRRVIWVWRYVASFDITAVLQEGRVVGTLMAKEQQDRRCWAGNAHLPKSRSQLWTQADTTAGGYWHWQWHWALLEPEELARGGESQGGGSGWGTQTPKDGAKCRPKPEAADGFGRTIRSTREGLGFPTQTRRRGFNFDSKMPKNDKITKLDSGEAKPRSGAKELTTLEIVISLTILK